MANFGLVITLLGPGFEPKCPYFESLLNDPSRANVFRVKNLTEEYKMFTADSFGDHRYIDVAQKRLCSPSCGCHLLNSYQECYVYTFVACIKDNSLQVQIHSPVLQSWLHEALCSQVSESQFVQSGVFCGFQLLKYRQYLMRSLDDRTSFQSDILERDLNILEDSVDRVAAHELSNFHPETHPESNTEISVGFGSVWCSLAELKKTWRIGQTQESLVVWGMPEKLLSISSRLAMLVSPIQRSYLEAELGCPENALIVAAAKGDLARVKMVFELTAKWTKDSWDPTTPLIDINAIKTCTTKHHLPLWKGNEGPGQTRTTVTEMTALMAAADGQHYEVTKLLIEQGADVNILTVSGTALYLADKDCSPASYRIGKLLMRNGADIHVALLLARKLGRESVMLNGLVKSRGVHDYSTGQKRNAFFWGGIRARQVLRQVHAIFMEEHHHILEASLRRGGLSIFAEPFSWQTGIEDNWKVAWKTGIRCLRRLCSGLGPTTINETIMFFAVSRAMSRCLKLWDLDHQESFADDVVRWQLCFSGNFSLLARKAFVHRVTTAFGIGDLIEDSFPATKLERNDGGQHNAARQEIAPVMAGVPSSPKEYQSDWHPPTPYQTSRILQSPNPLSDDVPGSIPEVHIPSGTSQTLVTFLMAGTIFATILSFLLITLHSFRRQSAENRAKLYKPTVTHALGHILAAMAVTLNVDFRILLEANARTLDEIQDGLIPTYNELGDVLCSPGHPPGMAPAYAQQLRNLLDAWYSSFLAQETYTLLMSYLGFAKYRSIIPDSPLPNQQVPHEPSVCYARYRHGEPTVACDIVPGQSNPTILVARLVDSKESRGTAV
ncbi:hypothetical protein AJ79_06764 [Helicocarpus griseus UAMH5409]|uniref:Uncharacterized protein n=1 Tax=Helicocarpus griseus UAMH5409 TaxID=1447875 RepID=A0A2B7XA67_9EURO|nr:hypothetical protein AJ79_06764 [Helicocarpus griseus UAMH5409]